MKVEKCSDGLMRLSGTFGVCGVVNNNRRIYNKDNYRKMVESLQERIKTEGCPGELEHPSTMNITLENVSHKIESIDIDENGVVTGTIALLNTPKGKIAQAIVEGGLPLFISSRAQGNVDKNGLVTLETLKTYDLVGTPGFSQARLHLNENQIAESLNESMYYIAEEEEEEDLLDTNENKENNEIDMTKEELEKLYEEMDALRSEVKNLREDVSSRSQFDVQGFANSIQSWITEEYAPELVNAWKSEIAKNVESWMLDECAPAIQEWISNEYSEKVNEWATTELTGEIKKYVNEDYSNALQKWICEEYSQTVNNWVNEELGKGIQKWIVEEYSPVVEKWATEELAANMVSESREQKLSNIDSILRMVEENQNNKPTYAARVINEDAVESDEPMFVKKMPAECVAKWNNASDDVKESIRRRAKMYNLTNEGAIDRFWSNIDFNAITPATSIYEGLDEIADKNEQALRLQLRKFRNQ
ncbi:MAG: hypothetical protein IIZ78_20770 [Clostridiales bacterium]|nr:hypothetical protein [Clostridiales bacterium]